MLAPNTSQLKAEQLAKSYATKVVVTDISVNISAGEVVGLLGPNGAGKTTTFYMITGLIKADKGSIFLNNQEITSFAIHDRARLGIGYLPQDSSIFRKLSVYDNIFSVLELQPNLTKKKQKQQCQQLLDEFKIQHIKDSLGQSLSGGERRRVELARTLAINPKFILLDEPFAGVDPISVKDIQSIIQYLKQKGIGVLITDHNVRETLQVCDRAYILFDGKLLAQGKPDEILSNKGVKKVYLGENFY